MLIVGGTVAEAARAAGKSERSVRYWMRTVEFDAVFKDTRQAALTRARLRLAVMTDNALEVLAECLEPFERPRVIPTRAKVKGKRKRGEEPRRVPLSLRRVAARDVLEMIGLGSKKDEDLAPVDEAKIEAALRRAGWVKRDELQEAG